MKKIITIVSFAVLLICLALVTLHCSSTGSVTTSTTSTTLGASTTTTSTTLSSSSTTTLTTTSTAATTTSTTTSATTTTIDISQYLSWTYVTGQIYWSSPAIGDDGAVYIGSSNQLTTGSADALYAINSDGTLNWEYETGIDSPVRGAPVIGSDGTIYCLVYIRADAQTDLYAIDSNGDFKWKYQDISEGITPTWGELTPALSTQEVIYAPGNNYLYAINSSGELVWRYPTVEAGPSFSTPAIGASGTIYANTSDGIYAINPDGTLKWKYEIEMYEKSHSPPALGSQETVYAGGGGSSPGRTDDYVYALSADGELLWRFQTSLLVVASYAIDEDGTIYFGTTSKGGSSEVGQCGIFYALNPNGTEKWRHDTSQDLAAAVETAQSDIYSSPAIGADGTIYFSSESRYFYAMNPDGTVKERYDMYAIDPTSHGCSAIVYSSPAIVADGTIYVGNYYHFLAPGDTSAEGAVYALISESEGLADTPWPRIHGNNKNTGRQN